MKDYLSVVACVDDNIGKMLKFLEENGLAENTVVVYASDQGFYLGEHGWFDKRFMYNESFKTPLIVRWPNQVKPGSVNNDLVSNLDFAETFLEMAGVAIPEDMQGRSLVPILKGEKPDDWRTSLYYHYYEYPAEHMVKKHEGVFDGRFKLIHYYDDVDEWELFDLQSDPNELRNVYSDAQYKDETERLKKELQRQKAELKVPPLETNTQSYLYDEEAQQKRPGMVPYFKRLKNTVEQRKKRIENKQGKREFTDTTTYRIVNDLREPPVFEFHNSWGHHGQRISDFPIDNVLVWKDGTIAWEVWQGDAKWGTHWYHSSIPAEKVEQAVQTIVESFDKYPVKDRPLETRMFFRLGAHSSPTITICSQDLYEFIWMDHYLYQYYKGNQKEFQSNDEEDTRHALLQIAQYVGGAKGLVNYYREKLPQAGLGDRQTKIDDEILLKCAELYKADAEHLLLMEKRILDLVPSHEGLEPKEHEYESQHVKIEQEIKDGKRQFYYSLLTDEEDSKIWAEIRKQRESSE